MTAQALRRRTSALSRAAELPLDAYRERHVAERVHRALEREGLSSVDELVRVLAADDGARKRFRRSVAVSVSGLFRDPAQFELLDREVFPSLVAARGHVGVWSAGCADGSELYSVAMLLDRHGVLGRAFLLGSDLLEENIDAARRGVYGEVNVSWRLRARTRWERRDLLRDGPPPGVWQLVLCRNLAIYLEPDAKSGLHRMLASSLAPGGVLLLGRSERLADPAAFGLSRIAPHMYRRVP